MDMDPKAPQHVVNHLPPYTNVSLKMILTNPEGRKESEETIIQTDEDGKLKFIIFTGVGRGGQRMLSFLYTYPVVSITEPNPETHQNFSAQFNSNRTHVL